MTWFSLENGSENTISETAKVIICKNILPEMVSPITPTGDFAPGFLRCDLPEDTLI